MPSQRIIVKAAASIFAILAMWAAPSGCSVKEARSECPLLVTLWPERDCRAAGSAVIWFCDGFFINSSLQADIFDSTTVVEFPVRKSTDRISIWGNITSKTRLEVESRRMTVNGKDCDSLYCAEAFPAHGSETFRQEMHFKRMYAKLMISVTGYEAKDPPIKILIRSTTTGYLADMSVIEGPSVLETMPVYETKGYSAECDTSHFIANVMRQNNLESLKMSVISLSETDTELPLGSMMAQSLEGSEEEDAFFTDYYIEIDLEHCTVSIRVAPWESEFSFKIEY